MKCIVCDMETKLYEIKNDVKACFCFEHFLSSVEQLGQEEIEKLNCNMGKQKIVCEIY
ncbi:hypothetical protein ACFLQN_00405 [Candidatus Aenigmatarchaeota archaeon]